MTTETQPIQQERDMLRIRLEKVLEKIQDLEQRIGESGIKQLENLYQQIEEDLDIRDTGYSIRSWYPMSGTTDQIKKDLK